MGKNSAIQWTHHTFNHIRGCARVSEGCRFCYAEALAKRNPATLGIWGTSGSRVIASDSMWRQPPKWDREAREAGERRRVFCASLADVFEDWPGRISDSQGNVMWHRGGNVVGAGRTTPGLVYGERVAAMDDVRRKLARTIGETPNLDWLLLTKRIEFAGQMIYQMWFEDAEWPRNYWLGTTVEDRKAKHRIDILRTIPAPLRFLSIEPLIEDLGELNLDGIAWVIVGGESGAYEKVRPFDLMWARSIRDQCAAASVPFFFKQAGSHPYDSSRRISIDGPGSHAEEIDFRDSHGGDWDEFPADLKVRQFPALEAAR